MVPMQSRDLATCCRVGRSPDAAVFGKGLDAWTAAQSDPESAPAKLMARCRECPSSESGAGYEAY